MNGKPGDIPNLFLGTICAFRQEKAVGPSGDFNNTILPNLFTSEEIIWVIFKADLPQGKKGDMSQRYQMHFLEAKVHN